MFLYAGFEKKEKKKKKKIEKGKGSVFVPKKKICVLLFY